MLRKLLSLFTILVAMLFAVNSFAFTPEEGTYGLQYSTSPGCDDSSCIEPLAADIVEISVDGHTITAAGFLDNNGVLIPVGEYEYLLYGRIAYVPGDTTEMGLSDFGIDAVVTTTSGDTLIFWLTDELYGTHISEGYATCSGSQCEAAESMMGYEFPATILPLTSIYQLE